MQRLHLRLLSPKTHHATELQRRQNSPRQTTPLDGASQKSTSPMSANKTNWQTWQTWQTRKNQPFFIHAHFLATKKHPKNPSLPHSLRPTDCHRQRMERGLTRIRRIFTDQEEATYVRCQPPCSAAHSIRVHPPNPRKSASYSSPTNNAPAGSKINHQGTKTPRNTKECRKGGAKNQATKPALTDLSCFSFCP